MAESMRSVLADVDVTIARIRGGLSREDEYLLTATDDVMAIAQEWLSFVDALADQHLKDARRAKRLAPSVSARLMAQKTPSTGKAA